MVMKLDQLVNGAINVGFGAAAVAVEGGKKVLDDLGTKGEQVRKDAGTPDIARSVSDMFEQAGGTISDLTERLGMQGETAAQRVLDELILARVRVMTAPERTAFLAHVRGGSCRRSRGCCLGRSQEAARCRYGPRGARRDGAG